MNCRQSYTCPPLNRSRHKAALSLHFVHDNSRLRRLHTQRRRRDSVAANLAVKPPSAFHRQLAAQFWRLNVVPPPVRRHCRQNCGRNRRPQNSPC
jgi:hypothetical protein